jgi:hypothetical protein
MKSILLFLFLTTSVFAGDIDGDPLSKYFELPKGNRLIYFNYKLVNLETNESNYSCNFLIDKKQMISSQDYVGLLISTKVLNLSFQEGINVISFSDNGDTFFAHISYSEGKIKDKMLLKIALFKNPSPKEDIVKNYYDHKIRSQIEKLGKELLEVDEEIEKIKAQSNKLDGKLKEENMILEKKIRDKKSDLLNKIIELTKVLIENI